jgi:hypothetical protein
MILADLGYGEGRHREVSPFLLPALPHPCITVAMPTRTEMLSFRASKDEAAEILQAVRRKGVSRTKFLLEAALAAARSPEKDKPE